MEMVSLGWCHNDAVSREGSVWACLGGVDEARRLGRPFQLVRGYGVVSWMGLCVRWKRAAILMMESAKRTQSVVTQLSLRCTLGCRGVEASRHSH